MESFEEIKEFFTQHYYISNSIIILLAITFAIVADIAIKRILNCVIKKVLDSFSNLENSNDLNDILKLSSPLGHTIPVIIVYFTPDFIELNATCTIIIHKVCIICLVVLGLFFLNALLNLINNLYKKTSEATSRPIKGFLQLFQILTTAAAVIWTIAFILGKSPVLLLSGLGAIAAVLMLIFQDTILSLVASIQLGSNNMIKIGDWITMPKYNADGFVVEVALHTIKVQNWDNTITTIPTRKFIEDSFVNWRGMYESGGRRIKRSLYIDQRSIRFLSDQEINKLKELVLLKDYLDEKDSEIAQWNESHFNNGATKINGRRLTNIGTFRIYIEKYLIANPAISNQMIQLVRQLPPESTGLPLELYCFTKSTDWIEHEKAQADVFDHLLAIMPLFGLRVFQECSDIYQEATKEINYIDCFPQQIYAAPIYPSDQEKIAALAKEYNK
jgi:miniconductance mechanosensitive channel